jgi:hypothetical protein
MNDLNERVDPKVTLSKTLMWLPASRKLRIETEEPNCISVRTLNDFPMLTPNRRLRLEPARTNERKDMHDPSCA